MDSHANTSGSKPTEKNYLELLSAILKADPPIPCRPRLVTTLEKATALKIRHRPWRTRSRKQGSYPRTLTCWRGIEGREETKKKKKGEKSPSGDGGDPEAEGDDANQGFFREKKMKRENLIF